MNRQQLYTLSGVLLASTALAGMAEAATLGHSVANGASFSTSALKIANTIFSTTATTADTVNVGGEAAFVVKFSNQFTTTTKFSVEIDISGAQFNTSSIGDVNVLVADLGTNGTSFMGDVKASSVCSAITPLVSKIIVDGCQLSVSASPFTGTTGSGSNASSAAQGILLSGVVFNTANSLATVGNTISLSGSVYNTSNPTQSFESITSGSIVTSAAPLTVSLSACSNVVANPTATPAAFDYLSTSNITSATLSMCLATVTITSSGALSTPLLSGGFAALDTAATSVNVTITDTVLGSAAVADISAVNGGTALAGTANKTAANFAGGAATFSVGSGSAALASNFSIKLGFTGSTPIPAAAAGSVTIVFGKGGTASAQAFATTTGGTAAINRGGFNSELNTFLTSANLGYTSYARLHNMGATAGTAQITVLNDATGAQLGSSFTTATIAAGQTLQLSNAAIETAAGITAAAGVNYTIQITGPFIGYAQHIIFNPATGQLADLSGFRNHDAGSGNSP